MKRTHGAALLAALIITVLPAESPMAGEPADAVQTEEASANEVRNSNRERAELAQAEAAQSAAQAVVSATKLDLDIRLIGPTSIAGDL
jgi:hypothetical protein